MKDRPSARLAAWAGVVGAALLMGACGGGGGDGAGVEPLFETLVVLGYPAEADGSPSAEQVHRIDQALRLYEAGIARRAIFTGGAVQNEWVEGEVMAAYAVERGLDPADAIVEPEARHTDENVRNSTALMRERDWTHAAIVSRRGHLHFVARCDADCVVRKGRTAPLALELPDGGDAVHVLDYRLAPTVELATTEECLSLVLQLQCLGAFQPDDD